MAEEAASVFWKLEKRMDGGKNSRKQLQVGSGIRNQPGHSIGSSKSFWKWLRSQPIPVSHPLTPAETWRLILKGNTREVPGPAEQGRWRQVTAALSKQIGC